MSYELGWRFENGEWRMESGELAGAPALTINNAVIPTGAARNEPRSGGICHRTQDGTKQHAQHAADSSTPLRFARNDAHRTVIASEAKQSKTNEQLNN
ncbi:MAG: hypothetical protein LBF81_03745 [Prevotellaceae bacterium]|jgi:hypothetical protein|nr:hypothetical protein [Prevotellaceae bacterium]